MILVVEDDALLREVIDVALSMAGYDVINAVNGAEVERLLKSSDPDLILLDLDTPFFPGPEFLDAWGLRLGPSRPLVLMTWEPEAAAIAASIGAVGYLVRPFSHQQLLASVTQALRRSTD